MSLLNIFNKKDELEQVRDAVKKLSRDGSKEIKLVQGIFELLQQKQDKTKDEENLVNELEGMKKKDIAYRARDGFDTMIREGFQHDMMEKDKKIETIRGEILDLNTKITTLTKKLIRTEYLEKTEIDDVHKWISELHHHLKAKTQ